MIEWNSWWKVRRVISVQSYSFHWDKLNKGENSTKLQYVAFAKWLISRYSITKQRFVVFFLSRNKKQIHESAQKQHISLALFESRITFNHIYLTAEIRNIETMHRDHIWISIPFAHSVVSVTVNFQWPSF